MQWIEGHMDDPDYEEPLLIVGQSKGSSSGGGGAGAKGPSAFSQLSKEEKIQAAKEMQAKIREKRAKEDAENKAENAKAWAEA